MPRERTPSPGDPVAMSRPTPFAPLFPLVLLGSLLAWDATRPIDAPPVPSPVAQEGVSGQLVELWARDAVACSLDATTGSSGSTILEGQLDLSDATVVYDRLESEHLTVGLARNSLLALVNLGPLEVIPRPDPRARGPRLAASVFHSIRREGDKIVFDTPGAPGRELRDASRILTTSLEGGPFHWKPTVGDTVLLRYLKGGRHATEAQLVKFLVVSHEPGERVTLRWQRLR